jgi:excisionase family DNA binding protein
MEVDLSESSLRRLADLIGEKIITSRNNPEPWLDIDTLSSRIGLSKKTIYKYTSQTDIPHKRGRPLRFRQAEVETWLKKR